MTGLRKKVRIKEIVRETSEARTFILEFPEGDINYKAGQFLTFIFDTRFGELRRNYSISSSPDLGEPVTITIKRIANGVMSRQMVDAAKPGEVLTTIGASGFFILPADLGSVRQLFLFAAGSGITPVFGLLKTVLHLYPGLDVVLVYSNRSPEDTIFLTALQALQLRYHKNLKIEWLFSSASDYTRARLSNWLLGELMKKYRIAPIAECLFYLCGPLSYMRMISITLLSAGANAASIHKEEFVIPAPVTDPLPPDSAERKVTLWLNHRQYAFRSAWPQTILQSAKRSGIELPYSCETGRCGTCAAVCTRGEVWMKYNEVLMDEDIKNRKVLTCTGFPVFGDIELDFDKI